MKIIVVDAYKTTDGGVFNDIEEAKFHQSKLDVVARLKDSDFSINFNTEVSDLNIPDLTMILELARIIKQH